jgi:hypothetical protein
MDGKQPPRLLARRLGERAGIFLVWYRKKSALVAGLASKTTRVSDRLNKAGGKERQVYAIRESKGTRQRLSY